MFQPPLAKVLLISHHEQMGVVLKENFEKILPEYFTSQTEVVVVASVTEAVNVIDESFDLIINDGRGNDKKSPELMNLLKEKSLVEKTIIMSWGVDATKFDLREFDWKLNIVSKDLTQMSHQLKELFP